MFSSLTSRLAFSSPSTYSSLRTFSYHRIPRTKLKSIFSESEKLISSSPHLRVQGWIKSLRNQKNYVFLNLFDGSSAQNLQIIFVMNEIDQQMKDELARLSTGASVDITGILIQSSGEKQSVELQASSVKLIGECPVDSYPLQKKRHSLEFLRTIGHLRPRTNTFGAVSRVSSCLTAATHQFFQREGFLHVHTPIITSSDCEGAGEMFRVSTGAFSTEPDGSTPTTTHLKEFFGKPTYLTVSGQLSAEAFACAVGDVYTFGPTFRAENSNTTRHLAEFHMVEPELAFADLQDAMSNAESYIKFVVKAVLESCPEDIDFFTKHYDFTLLTRLTKLIEDPFVKIPYREAVSLLEVSLSILSLSALSLSPLLAYRICPAPPRPQREIKKSPSRWKYPQAHFGIDLATEHERWLAETHFNSSCVFVSDYPKDIKAFYMRNNDDQETVASFDLLVPGMGELIGGSQREERYELLLQKIIRANLNPADYSWYLDTRRYGTVPHAGYGLGFERLICLVTSLENIRDAIPFPRYPGTADN